ncbi:MAG: PilZ domain-containing protein [Acidimicrobiales bacterium]
MTTRHRSAEARPETAIGAGRVRSRQLIAIAATAVAYLLWRVGWTLGTASPWFSVALLLLEVWAIGQLIVTAAVLRGGRRVPEPAVDLSNAVPEARDIAVVIDAATGSPDALRRTLVSMGETTTASSFVVILAEDDPVAASSIARAGGSIRVDPAPDRAAAFWAAAVAEERPFALWLEAGDVVTPSTLTRLAEHFVDADVAVVQGSVGLINADSFLHLREGHDEAAYERDVLLPALGRVGAAPWNGSGSMCRVEAIATIGGLDEGPGSREAAVARLHQRRLTTRHEAEPVIRRTAPDTIADYLRERQCQARDRLRLRAMAPGRPNRLARLALADTHLRSIRQFVATWLLVVALFVAPEPVSGSVPLWIAVAVVVHGLCAWARHSAAAGTMRWGDWVRQGWRTVGADLAGAASRKPRSAGRGSASGVKTLGRLRLATFTLVAIDVAVLARAATLIDPDLLPRFGTVTRFAALGAALLCIVALVDVMQVIVRRRQRRADHRIAVPLSAIVDENYCETSDLSPSGVGLVLSESRDVGSSITMTLAVPRLDGSVAAVDLDGTVRHTRPLAEDEDGLARHLVGVQFGELMPEAWSALFTYCAIVHPAGLDRRIDPEPIIGPATLDIRHSRLQKVMGPVSVMAGVLAAGTMFFGPGAGAAFASTSVGEARACVLSSDGSGRAGGLVQMHFDGVWNDIATTDESGCVALAVPRQGVVPVQVVLDGRTERIDQDLLWDPSVVFETTEVVVEVVSSSGEPVEGARVQWHGAVWRDAGRTGVDGTARFETWDQTIPVQVVLDGRTKRIDQNVRWITHRVRDDRGVVEVRRVTRRRSAGAVHGGSGCRCDRCRWHGAVRDVGSDHPGAGRARWADQADRPERPVGSTHRVRDDRGRGGGGVVVG